MAFLSKKNNDSDNEMDFDFHFPTSKSALIIFVKNPVLGKVKTRLAKSIGDDKALEVYNLLLKHTEEITHSLPVDKFVFYSEKIEKYDIWDQKEYRKHLQKGEDLGSKMKTAFEEVFLMGYRKIIIIGSDLLQLKKSDILDALEALNTSDYVIGPATDGGYYLLGMKKLKPELFLGKNWSTKDVFVKTIADLNDESYAILEERNDIDTVDDLMAEPLLHQFLLDNFNIKK